MLRLMLLEGRNPPVDGISEEKFVLGGLLLLLLGGLLLLLLLLRP